MKPILNSGNYENYWTCGKCDQTINVSFKLPKRCERCKEEIDWDALGNEMPLAWEE